MHVRCLLLVEEDDAELAFVRDVLERSHVDIDEVLVATTVAEAVLTVRTGDVDIVLLDGDADAPDIQSALRAIRAETDAALVVITGCPDEEACARTLWYGADEFIHKGHATEHAVRGALMSAAVRRDLRRSAARIRDKFNRLSEMVGV
jgi:DNA-binding response OmpR family regulator